MRRIFLIHGWRVKDPMKSIGQLAAPLEALGYETELLSYGYTLTPTRTKFVTREKALLWSARTKPGDVVIGHSNGATVAFEMSHHMQNMADTMVWINPALRADLIPGRSVKNCLVLYNPDDWVTRIAAYVPDVLWGPMGRDGYKPNPNDPFGRDLRMKQDIHGHGHSDWGDSTDIAATVHKFLLSCS